jgi:redox-sensitive bicupin YhaK (pirin superfamily)
MSAGRGVIHNEAVEAEARTRILQLWIRLPAADRDTAPHFALVRGADAPVRREAGAELRLYSGTSGGLRSPTPNHVPTTMVTVRLEPGASITQDLPASYAGFVYVLEGAVDAGGTVVRTGDVGFFDAAPGDDSVLALHATDAGARLLLYAGEPQRESLVHHGPFVAGSQDDIVRLFRAFRSGRFERLSQIAARQHARSA